VQGGIVHAFTGSLQQGQTLTGLGFKLGIGGAVTHPRAKKLRRTVAQLDHDNIVLETDSPDMKPAFFEKN
jgi:TatD DNase family protein